ncbi:MAG TPA: efflux RND transporter periplasmic adaptor subunit [Candidatus Aquabacterium excrementipullorum]|nr:efflux RND transporter periplasmic adaptor subunit [Candidatus Aquabacterium excrementipullorum]
MLGVVWMMASAVAAPQAAKPSGCLIEPEQVADVGSPVTGVIERLPVALGDTVDAGQPLVVLRADVERANAGVAALRSQVDAEVKAAQANVVLARQKVDRARQLLAQDFVSAQAVEQAVAEAEVASQKLKMAQNQQRIYGQEQAVAQAQLGLRTLRSPIRGVIVERYNNVGERVEDRPVVRVASIDPLRVSLMVPITQYGQVAVGDSMSIRPELPGLDAVRATVQYVDKVVDAASNTFRVRLSLPNPGNRLPGGLRCKADWNSRQAKATPTPTPGPATGVQPAISRPVPSQGSPTARATVQAVSWHPDRHGPADGLRLRPSLNLSQHARPRHKAAQPAAIASPSGAVVLAQAPLAYSLTLSPHH